MSSQRTLIRKAVIDRLIGKTICGNRVFSNRIKELREGEFPLILVYFLEEQVSIFAEAPRTYRRTGKLTIDCVMNSTIHDAEDRLDEMGQLVEHAMMQDHSLGGLCEDVVLTTTQSIFNDDGKFSVLVLKFAYDITYYSEAVADFDTSDFGLGTAEIKDADSAAKIDVRFEL